MANRPAIIPTQKQGHPQRFLEDYVCAHLRSMRFTLREESRQGKASEALRKVLEDQGIEVAAWEVVITNGNYPTFQVTVRERSAIDRLGDLAR